MKTVLLFLLLTLGTLTFAQESDGQKSPLAEYSLISIRPDDPDRWYIFQDSCTLGKPVESFPDSLAGGEDAYWTRQVAAEKWMIDCIERKVIPEEIVEVIRRNQKEVYYGRFIIDFWYDSSGKIYSLAFWVTGLFFEQLTVAQIKQLYWNFKQEKVPFVESFVCSEDVCYKAGADICKLLNVIEIQKMKEEKK